MRQLLVAIVVLAGCTGHGAGGGPGSCDELSLHDCRITDGCKPDLCPTCICDIAYRGCLNVADSPHECPQLGCPSAPCCSNAADCDPSTSCVTPGTSPGCGACNVDPNECANDDECAGNAICEPITCSCDGNLRCVDGCTSATCGEGTLCDAGATNRCIPQPCGAGGPECPGNFECANGSSCTRIQCTEDLDCDGFCTLGECFGGARGECQPPSA